MKTTIIRTANREELQQLLPHLKAKGFIQVTNAIFPNYIGGENFIQIDKEIAVWAFCSRELAERNGYISHNILTPFN